MGTLFLVINKLEVEAGHGGQGFPFSLEYILQCICLNPGRELRVGQKLFRSLFLPIHRRSLAQLCSAN